MVGKKSEKNQDIHHPLRKTPVAIIGMASIFPQATNLPEYWDNILHKINCITEVPPSRWNSSDYYDPDPTKPDKSYCKRGGFLPDIDFDPTEFGLPPNILEVTDVSQLLGLVVAKDALEDAGYGEGREFSRETTGVILGVVGVSSKLYVPLTSRLQYPVWERVLKASGLSDEDTQKVIEKFKLAYVGWEENSFPGSLTNVVAGRIANRFDLGATNCVLDAACATSMAAIKMAIMELVEGRADMMITGGVDTDNSIGVYMSFSKTPAFSKGEAVRTFDADSDGMMAGEGIGMLVLKRLADAERDGDRIYAVIRGVGSSSDGRFKSIYAPSPAGQAVALRRTYQEAGYSPATVGLVEAHGTGTPAGDPAEFKGLCEVFGEENPNRQYIAIGSVKSQIAHTKGAAGSAGMIKAALALHHKVLPPTINVNRPNPKLNIENSPFYVNTETRPWFRYDPEIPRRAGVSAFGFGGTNFHFTLEEYQSEQQGAYRTAPAAYTVLLSADTSAALLAVCQDNLAKLQAADGQHFLNRLGSVSQSAQVPLNHARIGFVAETLQEARELMGISIDLLKQKMGEDACEHPKGVYYRKTGLDSKGKIVALFSGQGSQYLEMGRELACNFPPVRQVFGEIDSLFLKDGLTRLSDRVFPAPVFDKAQRDQLSETLTRTEHAQPAIGAISVGLFKLLQQAGLKPDFAAGHSFGELTALWAAGVLSDMDYYFLAKARGKAMSAPEDPHYDAGGMLAVKGNARRVAEEIRDFAEITLANWNSEDQVVLAGAKTEIARVQQYLTEKGYSCVLLPVSAAFHTPLVGHAQKPFADAIDTVAFQAPRTRLFSNSTGKAHSSNPEEIRSLLKEHILNPVLFRDEIENIAAEGGYFFIEFGPKNVLTNLVKNILKDRPHFAVGLNASAKKDSDRQFREAVLQLRIAGLSLNTIDPYQAAPKAPSSRKKSPVTVKLNGGNYMSPKTKAAFENALQDGFKISTPEGKNQPAAHPSQPEVVVNRAQAVPAPALVVASEQVVEKIEQGKNNGSALPVPMAKVMDTYLSDLSEHQNEVVHLHEQYLRNEEMNGKIYARLSELELSLLSDASEGKLEHILPALEGLERSMARFHDHQAETLRVHEQYLRSQDEFLQTFVKLVQQQGVPVNGKTAAVNLPQPNANGATPDKESRSLPQQLPKMAVVEPTRAPVAVDKVKAERPSGNGNGSKSMEPAPAKTAPSSPVIQAAPVSAPGYSPEELTQALLKVVSEKTGYPVEMLELDTDMESDLGIDSIKRVEIMGEMRVQFPNLQKADPEAFAEMHTLGQTVEYMSRQKPGTVGVASPVQALQAQTGPVQAATSAPVTAPAGVSTGSYDVATLTQALLKVVSEKTGYPVEMLELDTDMESDLGIDSIKRVEIMGEMRSQFPELPKADPEAFAEMRTLGQTVQYMSASKAEAPARPAAEPALQSTAAIEPAASATNPPEVEPAGGTYAVEALTQALLSIVSEKTGYPVEMLELDTDMESDLGIDSIKRVEIMGEMRSQFPELPKADPEAFAEARTLGKIVDYLAQSGGNQKEAVRAATEETPAPVTDPDFQRGVVNLKSLPAPDFSNFSLPEGTICLMTDNGAPETALIAKDLTARNWKVVVLGYPTRFVAEQHPLPEGVQRVMLEDLSEEHLEKRLAEITAQFGKVAAFVHLNPPVSGSRPDGFFSVEQREIIKHVFLLAKHLKMPLTSSAKNGKGIFMVVVNLDGKFGLGKDIDFDPISGGLFGLVKTVNLEWDAVYCRALDISPELNAEQSAGCIMAELHDPNRLITEVGYSPEGRATLVIEQAGVLEEAA